MKRTKHLRIFMAIAALALVAVLAVPSYNYVVKVQAQPLESQSLVIDENNPLALLNELDATRGVKDVNSEYRLDKTLDVAYGKVYKFRQLYNGMEFFDSELIVTVDQKGKVLDVSGEYKRPSLTEAQISEDEALAIVEPNGSASIRRIVYNKGNSFELAYDIYADGMRYIVSAINGKVLLNTSSANNLMVTTKDYDGNEVTIDVSGSAGNYTLGNYEKNIFVFNLKNGIGMDPELDNEMFTSTTGDDFEPIAVSSYVNVLKAYDFYADAKNTGVSMKGFTYNNQEVYIAIYVHFGIFEENAACMFYPDSFGKDPDYPNIPAIPVVVMTIGDGNKSDNGMLYMPGRALDVIAHEYQHAITDFAADFVYQGDSGALDEAFSDMFGALIEGKDMSKDDSGFWQIGEDCVNASHGTELRSMIGGTETQSYSLSEKRNCTIPHSTHGTMCDNEYVHANSTIITHVQYELCREMPEFFTSERIGTLWYSTLCRLTSNATFADWANAFLATAKALNYDKEVVDLIEEKVVPFTKTYTVSFVDYDGTVIKVNGKDTQIVRAGDKAISPADPQRASDARADYTFKGWSESFTAVTKDIVAKAEYDETVHSFNVTFMSEEGAELGRVKYSYGDKLVLPSATDLGMEDIYPSDKYTLELYSDLDFTEKVEADTEITSAMIIYCKWVKISESSTQPGESCGACGTITFGGMNGAGLGGILLLSLALLLALVFMPMNKKKRSK